MIKYVLVSVLSLLFASTTVMASNPFEQSSNNPFESTKASPLEGSFSSDGVRIIIKGSGGNLSGKITMVGKNQTYDFTGSEKNNKLTGKFNSGGQLFPFSFALLKNSKSGIFKTGSFESKLNKVSTGTASKPAIASEGSATTVNMTSEARTEFEQALDIIRQESNSQQRNIGLSVFVSIIAKAGDFNWAKQIADGLDNQLASRDVAYQFIAAELVKRGRKADALDYQGRIGKDFMRDSFKTALAKAMAESGDFEGAIQMTPSKQKVGGLAQVATVAYEQGNQSKARDILSQASASASSEADRMSLIYATAKIRGAQEALNIMRSIDNPTFRLMNVEQVAREIHKSNSNSAKSELLNLIEQTYDEANQYTKPSIGLYKTSALTWLQGDSAALSNLGSVPDNLRESARSGIVMSIARKGDLAKARSMANDIGNTGIRDTAISSIIGHALMKKDFSMAERLIQDIRGSGARGSAMANIILYRLKG